MKEKDLKNHLAKVIDLNKEGKPIVEIYRMLMEDNTFRYEKLDIEQMDWDVARKEFSMVGLIK